LLGSAAQSGPVNQSLHSCLRVGAFENPALMGFQGGVDEVKIWNRALSQEEIAALSQPVATKNGLQLYFPFGEGSGSTTVDLTPSRFTGVLSGNADWADGKFGTAIQFTNGPATGLALATPVSLSGLSNFTISCWVKPNLSHQGMLLAKHNFGTDGEWFLRMDTMSRLTFTTVNADLQRVDQSVTTSTNLADGQWHLVLAAYNGATMQVYLDGSLLGSANQTGVLNRSAGSRLRVGAFENPDLMRFQGAIDEVKVWDRALGQDEIDALWKIE
ncbi:MAG TPA: LamG-like jellyroll fold domain-containing protein, partial [Verrucomicrobiae bacterium]|nr:LamG-like jellyroll fold domain-containing protein [Verrucomicrobiae bacterium]